MIRYFILWALLVLAAAPTHAQIYQTQYRVPGQNWMELNTERFRVVYPERYEAEAYRSLWILESEYEDIQKLVGGDVRHFPFIINPENDRSNGFVSPWNFRSEVELSPVIGKSMNPQSGDWLELVLPHELVHVLHFSENPPSVTRLLGLFSPDMRRSTHAAAPLGVHEGIAVQYESHNAIPHSGRGNYPYFRNKFRSMVDTPDEWSMGQLLQTTDFTPPFDRHYIGGYEFTNWLLSTYGENTVEEAIEFHYNYPFLGYGTALRHVTGDWPGKLYDRFSEMKQESEESRKEQLGASTDAASEEISFSAKCRLLNRPKWLDENTIIFFGRSCNRTSGFYAYEMDTGSMDLLKEVSISDDHVYSLSDDKSSLLYSRYHPDLLYNNVYRGDLHQLDLETGRSQRITKKQRLFSPVWKDHEILALQTEANTQKLVAVNPDDGSIIREYAKPDYSTVVQVAPSPYNPNTVAVLGRQKSVQGIWLEDLNETDSILDSEPDIVFDGSSIYDLSWHPSENRLLFVNDRNSVMNVYEYDVESGIVRQLTNSLYNAFEASISPDGRRIVYVNRDRNEHTLQVLNLDDALNREIEAGNWQYSNRIDEKLSRPLMNRETVIDSTQWQQPSSYRTGLSWIKPRYWVPTYEKDGGHDRFGLTLESVDLMNSRLYTMDVSHMSEKIWFDFSYIYKGFYPGFIAELYDEPAFTSFRTDAEEGEETDVQLLQESRGGSLKIPIPLILESNTRFTSLYVEPQYFISQIRFLDPDRSSPVSEFGTRHTVGLRSVMNLNLRQFIRDVQPNSGWIFYAEARQALNRDQFFIETDQLSVDGSLVKKRGFRAGVYKYLAPLKRWNQSLRVSGHVYTQTDVPVFGLSSEYSDLFPVFPLGAVNNVGLLNTRYTIPLIYPDDGGLLLPVYLSNIYLVLFSQTVTDLDRSDHIEASRSVFGAGIRSRFRLSNFAVDLGISIGWEPTRNRVTWHFGDF